jgi:hypothetical protein
MLSCFEKQNAHYCPPKHDEEHCKAMTEELCGCLNPQHEARISGNGVWERAHIRHEKDIETEVFDGKKT